MFHILKIVVLVFILFFCLCQKTSFKELEDTCTQKIHTHLQIFLVWWERKKRARNTIKIQKKKKRQIKWTSERKKKKNISVYMLDSKRTKKVDKNFFRMNVRCLIRFRFWVIALVDRSQNNRWLLLYKKRKKRRGRHKCRDSNTRKGIWLAFFRLSSQSLLA